MALYDSESVLPPDVLVPLLFRLRAAYSSPALQAELLKARKADTSQYHGTWRWSKAPDDFVMIVKSGFDLRANGRLEDGRSWHANLEQHAKGYEAAARASDGLMLFRVQVHFHQGQEVEKRGLLQIRFSSLGGHEELFQAVAAKATARSKFVGTPTSWEQQEILSRVQGPIFESFGLPGPPAGVWVLLRSVVAHEGEHPEVMHIGQQCRRLLGQVESELDEEDAIAAAAYGSPEDLWALVKQCGPAPPAPLELAVKVRSSGLHGEGLVALRAFEVGQEILREEPLAELQSSFSSSADLRRASLRLIGSGQMETVLRSSLWRGPPDGPKARELANLVDMCLDDSAARHRAGLLEALRAFGFNAFATRGDSAQVLYAVICKANHSCKPNASIVVPDSGPGQLVCIRPVATGEEITVSYLNAKELSLGARERLARLHKGWEFTCNCASCTNV